MRTVSESLMFLFFITAFFTFCSCKPITFDTRRPITEDIPTRHKRQGGFFAVLGVAGLTNGTSYPRLEIRDLEKNHPDQWNIYLLGLRRFQMVDQSDKLSYYQISGMWSPGP